MQCLPRKTNHLQLLNPRIGEVGLARRVLSRLLRDSVPIVRPLQTIMLPSHMIYHGFQRKTDWPGLFLVGLGECSRFGSFESSNSVIADSALLLISFKAAVRGALQIPNRLADYVNDGPSQNWSCLRGILQLPSG